MKKIPKALIILIVLTSLVFSGAVMAKDSKPGKAADNRVGSDARPCEDQSLTETQKAAVADILSRYDAGSLTAGDARAINNTFREAGIRRGPGQREAIRAAGFDPDALGRLAPPPDRGERNRGKDRETDDARQFTDAQKATVASILSKYDHNALTAGDAKAINDAFRGAGLRGGPGLRDAIEAAGYNPERISKLDPPPGGRKKGGPRRDKTE